MHPSSSRRGFLKGLMATAGAAVGTRLARPAASLLPEAMAAGEEAPVVVVLHTLGGYNALFCSADSMGNAFNANPVAVKGGFGVDASTLGTLSKNALDHMATIGVRHNISAHPVAKSALWSAGTGNYGIKLAVAAGGDAGIRAALIGNDLSGVGTNAEAGVSLQVVKDLGAASSVLGSSTLSKGSLQAAVNAARASSANRVAGSPGSLATLNDGYGALAGSLAKPAAGLPSIADLNTAYGFTGTAITGSATDTLGASFAGAELMIRGGARFVGIVDKNWDTHGDDDGSLARNMMRQRVIPGLKTFLDRVVFGAEGAGKNVVFCLLGDFSRSLDNSGHQPNLSVTVVGKNVKPGTTGAVNPKIGLIGGGKGGIPEMWAYLAAAAKVPGQPFGANPHGLVV